MSEANDCARMMIVEEREQHAQELVARESDRTSEREQHADEQRERPACEETRGDE
jgi:hypothetical protein